MIVVEYTPEQAAALKELINRAVKHSGLEVAEAAVVLHQKLIAAESGAKKLADLLNAGTLNPKD